MGSKWIKGFKVVVFNGTKESGEAQFRSAWSDHHAIYELGKVTSADRGCGPLGVFEKYENARRFADICFNRFILECVFVRSKRRVFYYLGTDNRKIVEDGVSETARMEASYATRVKPIAVVYRQDEVVNFGK